MAKRTPPSTIAATPTKPKARIAQHKASMARRTSKKTKKKRAAT